MQGAHPPSENGRDREQDGILEAWDHVILFGERIVDKNCEIFPEILNNYKPYAGFFKITLSPVN
jgi:hypothetical protein